MGPQHAAYYRIYVQGEVDLRWLADYYDLRGEREMHTHQPNVTIVTGELIDQTALVGVLSLMNDSGLQLLGFDCFPYETE